MFVLLRTGLICLGLLALLFCTSAVPASAQSNPYIDQEAMAELLNRRAKDLDALPEVYYDYYVMDDRRKNTVIARNRFYKKIGEGDLRLGKQRSHLVEMMNRVIMQDVALGDTLVIPTEFDLDVRAYSPFPRYYPGARDLDKLFIIHKTIQAFAAYEYGQLVRWGIVNTGSAESPTPTGRFNFNWKEEYRVSSLSPADEPWEMYWVFNFHNERGIHIHQYPMPAGGPMSHGCVRLIDADARWIYHWADAWDNTKGVNYASSYGGQIKKQGSTVLVLGEDPAGHPRPFTFKRRYPILYKIELPASPFDVVPGTAQQEYFDRLRASR